MAWLGLQLLECNNCRYNSDCIFLRKYFCNWFHIYVVRVVEMTEKRFTIHESMVCDRDMEISITLWQDKEQQKKFCDTLNNFHEENLRLKHENKYLQFAYDECSNNKLFSRRKLETENKNLKDENQTLKEFIKRLTSCDGKIYLMNGRVYNTKVLSFE